MNSLKGMGAVAVLAVIAVAVSRVADIRYFVLAVTVVLVVTSAATYVASRQRYRMDRETAELSGLTQVLTVDGLPAGPAQRRGGLLLAPALAVALLLAGGGYTGWKLLPSRSAGTDTDTAAAAGRPTPEAAKRPGVALPAGTLFDTFRYTGPDDPALAANGWQARADDGGPGIAGTWSAEGVSFPVDRTAKGGRALQLQTRTDGTVGGTR